MTFYYSSFFYAASGKKLEILFRKSTVFFTEPFFCRLPEPFGPETTNENREYKHRVIVSRSRYNPFEKLSEKVKKTDKIKEITKEIGIKHRQKCNNLSFLCVFLPAFLIAFLSFLLFLVAKPFNCQVTKITNGVYTGSWNRLRYKSLASDYPHSLLHCLIYAFIFSSYSIFSIR